MQGRGRGGRGGRVWCDGLRACGVLCVALRNGLYAVCGGTRWMCSYSALTQCIQSARACMRETELSLSHSDVLCPRACGGVCHICRGHDHRGREIRQYVCDGMSGRALSSKRGVRRSRGSADGCRGAAEAGAGGGCGAMA